MKYFCNYSIMVFCLRYFNWCEFAYSTSFSRM